MSENKDMDEGWLESAKELETIVKMVEIAEKNGLLIEAIWSFGHDMSNGATVSDAVEYALREWDM